MIKKCVVCGKEFDAKTDRAKYCSRHCANRSRYQRSAEDLKRKREKLNENIIKLYESDLTTKEIAFLLGIKSKTRIYETWRAAGLPKRLTKLQKTIKSLREEGKCSIEIEEEVGISSKSLSVIIRKIGMPFTEEEKRKAKWLTGNQFTKRTEEEKKDYVESFLGNGFSYVSGYKDCESMVTIKCEKCGTVFDRSMVAIRHKQKTTCPECARREKQKKEKERKKLAAEKEEKRKERQEQKERERLTRIRVVVCEECGTPFITVSKNRVCCSKECSKKRLNRLSSIRKDKRIAKDKRIDSDITTKKLYERDNGICWICGEKCDFDDYEIRNGAFIAGDNYPSVDHVVEICNGGEHSWDNVRLAHRHCNSERYWKKNA